MMRRTLSKTVRPEGVFGQTEGLDHGRRCPNGGGDGAARLVAVALNSA